MRRVGFLTLAVTSLLTVQTVGTKIAEGTSHTTELCSGFVPENDYYLPVGSRFFGGLDEAVFNKLLDQLQLIYTPIIEAKGGTLQINRLWTDGKMNARATRSGTTWTIHMYGGLARHELMTPLGFMGIACHEIGHHIAGAPRYWQNSDWSSTEGQSDYFATLKCLRLFQDSLTPEQRVEFGMDGTFDPLAVEKCDAVYADASDRQRCYNNSAVAKTLGDVLAVSFDHSDLPKFDSPDPKVVTQTYESHPKSQCRLDTYFQGALCSEAVANELDQVDALKGTCNTAEGDTVGIRPLCWYKP